MATQDSDVKYPNTKLDSVHCEIRFYPLLEIDNKIVTFQKDLREFLPNYRISKIVKRDNMEIQELNEHTFSDEDGKNVLAITNSTFIFSTNQYDRYSSFREKYLSLSKEFFDLFKDIKQILFLGLRYINKFEFDTKTESFEKILGYFNFSLDLDRLKEKKIENFRLEERFEIGNANFKRTFFLQKNIQLNRYLLLLDLDSNYLNAELNSDKLKENLNTLHKNIKSEFNNSITEACKQEILGLK